MRNDQLLNDLYRACGIPSDKLAYTQEFEVMHTTYVARTGEQVSIRDLFRRVLRLRKQCFLSTLRD